MVRGVPWDQLPNRFEQNRENAKKNQVNQEEVVPAEIVPHKFDASKDILDIGRRTLFGVVCGSLTGACFGLVEVLRDPTAMSGRKIVSTNRVLRFTYLFAGFFGAYHGSRKILQLTVPQTREYNILTAAAVSVAPLIAVGSLRPMIPYGVMLVAIDAYNELTENKV